MNQIEIQIIQLQSFERSLKRHLCAFVASILNPKFGGDKDLLPWHTTLLNGFANSFFVLISSGGINQTIARTDGFIYASFTLFEVSYLVDTEPSNGHLDTIIQYDLLHCFPPSCAFSFDEQSVTLLWFGVDLCHLIATCHNELGLV